MHSPQLLEAKPLVEKIKKSLASRVSEFKTTYHRPPGLAVVLAGEDSASKIYVEKKTQTAKELGFHSEAHLLPKTASASEIKRLVQKLNENPLIDGILIQRPAPVAEDELAYYVSPEKDVDGFHPESVGKLLLGLPTFIPCTPLGILKLLEFYKIPLDGKNVCVIGRSSIVGKPLANLFIQKNATVTVCHSHTKNLKSICKSAEILVVAMGKSGFITNEYLSSGCVVIDVGINRSRDNKITGDVDFDSVKNLASAITPVPGGVGPMTISMLLENTLLAAELRESKKRLKTK